MNYSELRQTVKDLAGKFDILQRREIMVNMTGGASDFTVDNYRFIAKDEIDTILVNELESDPYMLGCFRDWFIANNTDLSLDIVRALQSAEKYEEIGQHIIDNEFTANMAEAYASADGYRHHFASYDGNEHKINDYYYFIN